jgi:2-alkenal reductase
MNQRITRIILIVLLIAVGAYIAQPYIDRLLYSASTPRTVEPRGSLSELERSTIELFEHVSPSVVQVVGTTSGGLEAAQSEGEGVPAQTGTGFIWRCGLPRARCCAHNWLAQRPTTTSR